MTQDNTPSINIDDSLVQEFIDESLDMLSSLDSRFIELEEQPGELSIIEAIFRPVHSIKGNSGFFGFVHVKHLAHELETLLDLMRKSKLGVKIHMRSCKHGPITAQNFKGTCILLCVYLSPSRLRA